MNTEHFKEKLLAEKARLEKELGGVGRINPDNPADWEPTPVDMNVMQADKNEAADQKEEYEERSAVQVELETRLGNVDRALERIEAGTYGICKVRGEQIEEKRLEANPAAETCMAHLEG